MGFANDGLQLVKQSAGHGLGSWAWSPLAAAKAASRSRHRTCKALAVKSIKHNRISTAAQALLGQASPCKRITPSAKYNHTTKLTHR
jgi:diketogulonate reductase-like aldo/keto reductase